MMRVGKTKNFFISDPFLKFILLNILYEKKAKRKPKNERQKQFRILPQHLGLKVIYCKSGNTGHD
jgi:hypothetical protein